MVERLPRPRSSDPRRHMVAVFAQHAAWARGICTCDLCCHCERRGGFPKGVKGRKPGFPTEPEGA
jgi:hypothetical protein